MATEPSFYPEINQPLPMDSDKRLLSKIAGSLYDFDQTGMDVTLKNADGYPTASTEIWRASFPQVGAGVLSTKFEVVHDGYWNGTAFVSGTTVESQSAGNLVITASTIANDELILRSKEGASAKSWAGPLMMRVKTILSQRIANNNFIVQLADRIGENFSFTSSNATSVVVTIPNNPFTSQNVGQGMVLCGITQTSGASACPPQRATIASVSGNDVTYTVSGYPAGGSAGTLDIIGWNFIRFVYDSTTATNVKFDCQRDGWNSGDTTLAISSTAAPGHVVQAFSDSSAVVASDNTVATTVGLTNSWVARGSRIENIPADDTQMYLYIVSRNGTTAPASATTWTIGFATVEKFSKMPMMLANQYSGPSNGVPVSGTVQTSGGARSTANTIGNTHITGFSAMPSSVTTGRNVDILGDLIGRPIMAIGGIPTLEVFNRVVLTNTTETTLIAAVASSRNIVYDVLVANLSAANSVQVDFRDTTGGTIRKTVNLAANSSIHISVPAAWVQQANNTNWTVQATGTTPNVAISSSHFTFAY